MKLIKFIILLLILTTTFVAQAQKHSLQELINLGLEEQTNGNYSKAEVWFEKSVKKAAAEYGRDHSDYATALICLARVYLDQGKYTRAEPLYLEARNVYAITLGKGDYNYGISLLNLAFLYNKQGAYTKAENFYLESKDVLQKALGEDHQICAMISSGLADLYRVQGHYAKAEPLQVEAKNILKKTLGASNPEYGTSLLGLANLYLAQGLGLKAEPLLIEAKNIYEKALGKNHPNYAVVIINLARLYGDQEKYTKAESLYIEAKDIIINKLGTDNLEYAGALNNLAVLYLDQEQYIKAEPLLIEYKNIHKKILGTSHPDYAISLNNLALLYHAQEKYTKAELLFIESKSIFEKSLGKVHPNYAQSLSGLASLYEDQGLHAQAEPYYMEANHTYIHQIKHNFSQLSEKEKIVFYNTFSYKFDLFHSFVLKRMKENPAIINEDYKVVLATKGLLFNAQQKIKERILNSNDSELITLYNKWQEQLVYLSSLYEKMIQEREEAGINLEMEEQKANELEKKISSKSVFFAKKNDKTAYNWRDVQKKLGEKEASIEIIRFKYHDKKWTDSILYVAMIIKPTTKDHPEVVVLKNGTELEDKYLKNYKNSIKFKLEDKKSFNQYWQKINQILGDVDKVYLSQNGVYHSLNLGGLLNPKTGKYLIDEMDIQIVTSTKDIVTTARKKRPIQEVKLLGFPTYNSKDLNSPARNEDKRRSFTRVTSSDSLSRFFDGSYITPLPGTQIEVNNLSEIMKEAGISVSLYTEQEATEAIVKSWKNPMIAHIATHGYFLKDDDINSVNDRIGGISREAFSENPLLRSGLLLANAKQAIQNGGDGILTAYEAQNLDLDETELVVLSACETGLGEVKNGEGVFGLQRAFQTAGAATILMSLWTVSDDATQELMTIFYDNWLIKKQIKRTAFKNAQNKLREKFPEPYYWAAFVMIGE